MRWQILCKGKRKPGYFNLFLGFSYSVYYMKSDGVSFCNNDIDGSMIKDGWSLDGSIIEGVGV